VQIAGDLLQGQRLRPRFERGLLGVVASAEADGEDLVVTVPDGARRLIGPFPKRTFGQPAGANESEGNDQGRVYVDYSATTSVTRAVVALS
jgi:hypothetical protein